MAGSVFLSYRRDDAAGYAGRLYDRLRSRFPKRVFMDIGGIAPGSDFPAVIEKAVGNCTVLIALIGRQWLSDGRIHDPADFVRLEIASALRRGIRVIPVLVGGAAMPSAGLPADVADLLHRQAVEITDADWDAGCERLVAAIAGDVGRARKPASSLRWMLGGAAIAAVVAIGLIVFWPRTPPPIALPKDPKKTDPPIRYVCAEYNGIQAAADALDDVTRQMDGAPAPPKISLNPTGRWLMAIQGENQNPVPIEFSQDYTASIQRAGARRNSGCWRYGGTWNLLRFDFVDKSDTNLELRVTEVGANRFIASAVNKVYEFARQ